MSILVMVNEKFRETVPAWACFHEREDEFPAFINRVLSLKEDKIQQKMSVRERKMSVHCSRCVSAEGGRGDGRAFFSTEARFHL